MAVVHLDPDRRRVKGKDHGNGPVFDDPARPGMTDNGEQVSTGLQRFRERPRVQGRNGRAYEEDILAFRPFEALQEDHLRPALSGFAKVGHVIVIGDRQEPGSCRPILSYALEQRNRGAATVLAAVSMQISPDPRSRGACVGVVQESRHQDLSRCDFQLSCRLDLVQPAHGRGVRRFMQNLGICACLPGNFQKRLREAVQRLQALRLRGLYHQGFRVRSGGSSLSEDGSRSR